MANLAHSVLLETVFSALVAPVLMLYRTFFILSTLAGRRLKWITKNRAKGGGLSLGAVVPAWQTSFPSRRTADLWTWGTS